MRFPLRLVLLMGFVVVANLPASTVLTCGSATGKGTPTLVADPNCYSLANFSNFHSTESVDWFSAYGSADSTLNVTSHDTVNGSWQAADKAIPNGPRLAATLFAPTADATPLRRLDNLANGALSFQNFVGSFGVGDHLLGVNDGVLELQFDRAINGAVFRISVPTSADFTATVAAYSQMNPNVLLDTPLMTYSMNISGGSVGFGPGGRCDAVDSGSSCNNAPYIGIQSGSLNIQSLVISTNNKGVLIDTLFLDVPAPEPSTFALTGVVGILAILGRRRRLRERRS